MMGKGHDGDQAGIIPRLCKDLFVKINQDTDEDSQYSVEVSFLKPKNGQGYLTLSFFLI